MEKPSFLIGIAGGTGSGKTYIAQELQKADPNRVLIFSHDHYYRDRSDVPLDRRKELNYDEPAAMDEELFYQHLMDLRAGKSISMPQYDFGTHTRAPETVLIESKPVIIVEGILILTDPRVVKLLDLTIFIDIEADIRLARRLTRDVGERDRSFQESLNQYLTSAQPMHDKYVEPGKEEADLIINNNGTKDQLKDALETVQARILEVLGETQ
jgi:uridine kinase